MRPSNIAFDNLRAEMSRKNIGICDLARELGVNRDTLARKLSKKSPLGLEEAFRIQQMLFPGMDIRYLFDTGQKQDTGHRLPERQLKGVGAPWRMNLQRRKSQSITDIPK